jgi:hypothetical protein
MINIICTILLLSLSAIQASPIDLPNSKSSPGDSTEMKIPIEQDKIALQLAVSDFFTFKNLKINLNLKRRFSDELALRIGFYLNIKFTKSENGNTTAYSGYGSNLFVQYYFTSKKRLSSYVIGGLQYDYEEYDYDDVEYPDELFSYGIGGGIGVEYFYLSSMSMFAEFSAVLAYEVEKKKLEEDYETYGTVRFRSNSVSFGLSVYF